VLVGEYRHTIDDKGRLILPAKFRNEFADGLVITKGFEKSLFVYSKTYWLGVAEKIQSMQMLSKDVRQLSRFFFGGACETSLDRNGRLILPPQLRSHAEIKKEVVFLGVYNRLEIWSKEKWEAYEAEAESSIEEVAEKLRDIGI